MPNPSLSTKGTVFSLDFIDWQKSVCTLLETAGFAKHLDLKRPILIKPNLVEALKPPITTPVELVAALIDYLRKQSPDLEIIVGEGCGSLQYDTEHAFDLLGYTSMGRQKNVKLLDLNKAPLARLSNPGCRRWPEMHLPQLVFDCYLISVPVLKAHSLAGVTLTLKNMMGLAPPRYYQQGGHWKKAAFHHRIQEAVLDLNRYRTPDFTILDATVGMQQAHLWGPTCKPPPNKLAAGFDPAAIDAFGANLLKKDWRSIGHIKEAHGELGWAEPLEIIEPSSHD